MAKYVIEIYVPCPKCGEAQEDDDGFGFIFCEKCGYCVHPSITDGKCDCCGVVK